MGGGGGIVIRMRETKGGGWWKTVGDSEGASLLSSSHRGASPVLT